MPGEPIHTACAPCPFCGFGARLCYSGPTPEQARYARSWGEDIDPGFYFAKCDACGATTDEAYTESEAAAFWNRRAPPSPTAAHPLNPCPNCGHQKASDLIGHRHTGAQCYWCGHSTDRDPDPKASHPATLPPGSRSVDPADTGVGRSYGDAATLDGALHRAGAEGR